MSKPGRLLRRMASRCLGEPTMTRLVDPVIADWQAEYADAVGQRLIWKSRWIRYSGYAVFAKTLVVHGAWGLSTSLRGWSGEDSGALRRMVGISTAATVALVGFFAYIPFAPAMLLWNALNAGALYVAIRLVLPRRPATVARTIVFLDMLGSLQNVQSNALVAALIILTFAAYERSHTAIGSVAAVTGTYIKVFPLAGVSFALFHPRKLRVAVAVTLGMVGFALLPLLVTPLATLTAQYASWRAIDSRPPSARTGR